MSGGALRSISADDGLIDDIVSFYALDVGRGFATDADFWHV
jgi:hypothetical protein